MSIVASKLWQDGKTRTAWFNKIRNQKNWISCLSHLEECECKDDEQYLRVVKHLDVQVLYWALNSLYDEIKQYSKENK